MDQVGIIAVGSEILDGIVLDTNSQWIINQLKAVNFDVKEIMTVRDDVADIALALIRMLDDGCNIIFTSGGLGPTHDDLTLIGVAKAFEIPLMVDEEALNMVKRQYNMLHKEGIIDSSEITQSRRKMATLPEGSRALDNRVGGAPGVLLERGNQRIFCLPGVPEELKWIFKNQIVPMLHPDKENVFAEKIIVLPLRDETKLAPIIDEVMEEYEKVYVKSMVKPYGEKGIRIWISSRGENRENVEWLLSKVAERLREITEERLST